MAGSDGFNNQNDNGYPRSGFEDRTTDNDIITEAIDLQNKLNIENQSKSAIDFETENVLLANEKNFERNMAQFYTDEGK